MFAKLSLVYLSVCMHSLVLVISANNVEQMSECSVKIKEGTIDLSVLDINLEAQLGDGRDVWNYTFNPCFPFTRPENIDEGFGDKCIGVALCKHKIDKKSDRGYYYNLGYKDQASFDIKTPSPNTTYVNIIYKGFWSRKGKVSTIRLVCDEERTDIQDALFVVLKDRKYNDRTLGLLYAELHHVACCPDGYRLTDGVSQGNNTGHLDGVISSEEKDNRIEVDRTKVLMIVGINVGIILMAGCVGLMCYNKRTHIEIYHKLPGVRTTAEPTLWQLATSQDIEQGPPGPIILSGNKSIQVSSKLAYRDGAPQRRKSLCFPVLEHTLIPEECIELGQRLGGTIFGDTYVGDWTGIKIAVKRITLSVHKYQTDPQSLKPMQDLVAFLSQQRHRNIVSMLGMCSEARHPYIISEFIQGQVMKDFIKQAGNQLTWPHRIKMLSQIADGMAFLHSTSPPILHRDLRCGNLFITSTDVVKICDYGVIQLMQPLRSICKEEDCCCQGLYSACPPSISWTAPEVLEHPNSNEADGYISTAADVYSYAITMWELVMGDDPYEEMHVVQEVIDHVVSGGRPEIPKDKMLKPYTGLMKTCWDANPNERLSFKQITVQLKELNYQAKAFQKALNHHSNKPRSRQSSKTISFTDTVT
ncbi:fibroblast growth factor receptor-like [Mya arenaria]|uniref:fibroblast growth factor receptor-like n=1 Tax=Mya arenaria TaxID=6604 RepID=UPI0022E399DE|nr:fibroblast growth factor receptor-like [Mya arenaria]